MPGRTIGDARKRLQPEPATDARSHRLRGAGCESCIAGIERLVAERQRLRDTISGHEAMHWPAEAHRLQQQRNEANRELEALRERIEALITNARKHSGGPYTAQVDALSLERALDPAEADW